MNCKISCTFEVILTKKHMRYFTVFLFSIITCISAIAQSKVNGVVRNEYNQIPLNKVAVINMNTLEIATSNHEGQFSITASANDVLQFSVEGFKTLKLSVTNDWFNYATRSIYMKEDVEVLEEIFINKLRLTGILQIDSRLIAFADYPYTRDISFTGFTPYTGFNPIKNIYQSVKNNSKQTQNINKLKEQSQILELMKSRYDRELVSSFLEISKVKIVETLQLCNYDDQFIYTATDFEIFTALNQCANAL